MWRHFFRLGGLLLLLVSLYFVADAPHPQIWVFFAWSGGIVIGLESRV